MGIAKDAATYLIRLRQRASLAGDVLCLGKQDLYFDYEWLVHKADEMKLSLNPDVKPQISPKQDFKKYGYITDTCFFKAIGFDNVQSMDHSDYEDADIIHDLNSPSLHIDGAGRYSLIVDGGTFEHIFHIPNALTNTFHLLNEGGWIVHMSPSSNYVDHGFYSFSPTLFWDYYHANSYNVDMACLVAHEQEKTQPWEFYHYDPESFEPCSCGGLDSRMWLTCIAAQKTSFSSPDKIPQQGYYTRVWKSFTADISHHASSAGIDATNPTPRTIVSAIKELIPEPPKKLIKHLFGLKAPVAEPAPKEIKKTPPLPRFHP